MEQIYSRDMCSQWGRLEEGCRPICVDGQWFYIGEAGMRLTNGIVWQWASFFCDGYAVVRDEQGEFHIDRQFKPLYAHRFKSVGNFYTDGRTWARTHDGAEVFINTAGELTPSDP